MRKKTGHGRLKRISLTRLATTIRAYSMQELPFWNDLPRRRTQQLPFIMKAWKKCQSKIRRKIPFLSTISVVYNFIFCSLLNHALLSLSLYHLSVLCYVCSKKSIQYVGFFYIITPFAILLLICNLAEGFFALTSFREFGFFSCARWRRRRRRRLYSSRLRNFGFLRLLLPGLIYIIQETATALLFFFVSKHFFLCCLLRRTLA